MALNTEQIYGWMKVKFSADASGTRFPDAFSYALSRVYTDLTSDEVGMDAFVMPTDKETDIPVDDKYLGAVTDLLAYHIQFLGEWGTDDVEARDRLHGAAIRRANGVTLQIMSDAGTLYTRLGDTDADDD